MLKLVSKILYYRRAKQMEINRLRLNQYRSYAALDLRPGPGINAIVGDNAEGKTNSVEAVFLCAFGRSHRTSRDAELIMRGCAGGYVGAELTNNTGSHLIEIKLRDGERKKIFIDRQMASRSGELMGLLNVVMFAPEDLSIVKDGPAERRRFMDMELSQTHPAYYYSLQRYNAALKQRNALLKEPDRIGPGMLETWDEQLAALGEEIVMDRCEFIDGLSTIAYDLHKSITGGRERLEIVYEPDIDPEDPEGIYGAMLKALDRSRAEDLRRGFTTAGPHRDDIGIALSGIDVRTFGSQGQKRTAALSLKLSELAFIREIKEEAPVLILDDVLSELDEGRQQLLMESMKDCQCFLTCTSLEGLKRAGLGNMNVFRCKGGEMLPE